MFYIAFIPITRRTAFFCLLGLLVFATAWWGTHGTFPGLNAFLKWDGGWYESIARSGYRSPIPPLFQNVEASNVAFFPAYPLLGRLLAKILRLDLAAALPLLSILCTLAVSILISGLLEAETLLSRGVRYLILFSYPATFYLFMGYSESLYIASLLGVIFLVLRPRPALLPALVILSFIHGGTRLTGFVIPAFLAVGAMIYSSTAHRKAIEAAVSFFSASLAAAAFFLYCAIKFGNWNLYFWQLSLGWYKVFSPVAALGIAFHPPEGFTLKPSVLLENPRYLSWFTVNLFLLLGTYACVRAFASGRRFLREHQWEEYARCVLIFGATAHLAIVACGDVGPWDYWANGLRYAMPSLFVYAIAWRDEWIPRIFRHRLIVPVALLVIAFIAAVCLRLESAYLLRFLRSEWVS